MRRKTALAAVAVGILALIVPVGAQAGEEWPLSKPYVVAGSTGATFSSPLVAFNNAGGAVDCDGGIGGACFDVSGHFGVFTVTAKDAVSGSVGIFMGFDMDGDGCVACKNGMAGLEDGDLFWQGADSVTGVIPDNLPNPTLFVFVRVATANTGDFGTTGDLTIQEGCGENREGEFCKVDEDPEMGTVCPGREPGVPTGGQCMRMGYPYAGRG